MAVKQRTIRGAKKGKKPLVRQAKKSDLIPRRWWQQGKLGRELNDRVRDADRHWMDR